MATPKKKPKETIPVEGSTTEGLAAGRGLDIGTSFIVGAQAIATQEGGAHIEKIRNAFLKLDDEEDTASILERAGVSYIRQSGYLYTVGDGALSIANAMGIEVRRPMSAGVLSTTDAEAAFVMRVLIENVLGKASYSGETCVYTVPAEPLNKQATGFFNTEFHLDKMDSLLRSLGFSPIPVNEGACIAYDQLRNKNLTGITCSLGAGQINICAMVLGTIVKSFSIIGSGDYVDAKVASQFAGMTSARVQKVKERQLTNLLDNLESEDQVVAGIALAYRRLIKNVIENMKVQFQGVVFPEPVDVVVAGGTSLAPGFLDMFVQTWNSAAPQIEVGQIRQSEDALFSVARGALYRALVAEKKARAKEPVA
jgi:hypothetical protein